MPVTLTTDLLIQNEPSLQSIIKTNYGLNVSCSVYYIQDEDNVRTEGLTKDAVAKIVIRDMRVISRKPFDRIDFKEHIERIYVWSDCKVTNLPDEYADAILQWINEVVLSISLPSIAEACDETSETYESS